MHAHDYLNPTQLNPTVASDNDKQLKRLLFMFLGLGENN